MGKYSTAIVAAAGLLSWIVPTVASAEPGEVKLPGTRPAILAEAYPSLQAAIDALPEQGGEIRLPAGEFEISEPLIINKGDVSLRGCGGATHLINVDKSGRPALHIRGAHYDGKANTRIWRVQIADVRITGNPQSGDGVLAEGVNEILITGVTLSEHGRDGIRLESCYEDPRLIANLISYNKQCGVWLSACHDIVVSANHFEENRDALLCADSFNLCMSGNNLDDHLRHGVIIEKTYGSVVSGNMIEECQGAAVVLDRDCYGITVSANVIAHDFGGGVLLLDAHGCAVSANTFTIVPKFALRVSGASGRITISGNNFSSSFDGEGDVRKEDDRQASGIVLDEGAREVLIQGNAFTGLSTPAIDDGGHTHENMVISGNLIVGESPVSGDAVNKP